jgi:hypothetical protein
MTKQTNHKPGATTVASAIAPDAYTRITNRIVADLEQGVRPWCKPWGGDQLGARITRPRRANGKPYSGINTLSLAAGRNAGQPPPAGSDSPNVAHLPDRRWPARHRAYSRPGRTRGLERPGERLQILAHAPRRDRTALPSQWAAGLPRGRKQRPPGRPLQVASRHRRSVSALAWGTPMYVDEAWRPPGEPQPREPRPTERQERVFLWLIAVNALLLLIAPVGGATIIHAVLAMLRHG